MTYAQKDHYGHEFRVADHYDAICVSVESSTSSKRGFGATYIPKADAPRIALEILKAAGWVTTSGSIGGDLEAVALSNEGEAKRAALEKRRAEVCKELGAAFVPAAADTALKRAIDRIIELEQASK